MSTHNLSSDSVIHDVVNTINIENDFISVFVALKLLLKIFIIFSLLINSTTILSF